MPKTQTKSSGKKPITKRPRLVKKSRGEATGVAAKPPGKKIVRKTQTTEGRGEKLPRQVNLQANLIGIDGKPRGKVSLPAELFATPAPRQLLAQAVRVYLANQREGAAATKTRGEVEGSTRKIYKQKGTGRARHGAIRAPIFVGGGIVFGPKPRDYRLGLPKKMRRMALAGALSAQYQAGNVIVVDGLETLEAKTKKFAQMFAAVGAVRSTLFVVGKGSERAVRGARNIRDVDLMSATNLNPYTVLAHDKLVFAKQALELLKETFLNNQTG